MLAVQLEFHALALSKMEKVLGDERARRLMTNVLAHLGIELRTADDLLTFANELSKRGGFEGAVGAMLSVRALMHGAAAPKTSVSSGGAR